MACFGGAGYYEDSEDSDPDAWFEREQEEKFDKVDEVQQHLPHGWAIREVVGSHRKPCSDCGHSSWFAGEFYVYDAAQPWGTDKYCLDCAEMKFVHGRDSEDSDDDEEDELLAEGDRAREIEPGMEALGYKLYDDFQLIRAVGLDPIVSAATSTFASLQARQAARMAAICCKGCSDSLASYYFCNKRDPKKDQYCSKCSDDGVTNIPDLTKLAAPALAPAPVAPRRPDPPTGGVAAARRPTPLTGDTSAPAPRVTRSQAASSSADASRSAIKKTRHTKK